ncbi:transposase, partial [Catenibacterium mitsuokai]|uniref:transposase n=1 Tax=Catenibacterium mitsuokai TaxID=100886 RepID=UPI0018A9A488
GCPFLSKCTQSKKHVKTITRHVWESDREEADYIRQTDEWKIVYPQRKETIERVFADAKENHGMRFTRLIGLVKNQHESLIIFSCHNLKKLGLCKRRMGLI